MADKEVQLSKTSTVSAVPAGKKTTATKTNEKPGSSSSSSSKKETGSLKEVLEVLQILNTNVNAQNLRLDKQEQSINELMDWTDEGQYNDFETQSEAQSETCVEECEPETETKSIFKNFFDKFQQSELLDVDVHTDLASLVNTSFRNGLSEENLEEMTKQSHRPQNCDSLVKTRVNQGIWRQLKSYTQTEDSRLSAIQGVMLKASVNVVKLVEKLGAAESEHIELGTTAIVLLGHANKMINSKRKELHKADLDYKYHYLTSASLPYTDLLYGNDNDVNNNVREINNMNRIGKTTGRGGGPMRGQGRGRRGFTYNPYVSRGRGFRGRGRGSYPARTETSATKNGKAPQKK